MIEEIRRVYRALDQLLDAAGHGEISRTQAAAGVSESYLRDLRVRLASGREQGYDLGILGNAQKVEQALIRSLGNAQKVEQALIGSLGNARKVEQALIGSLGNARKVERSLIGSLGNAQEVERALIGSLGNGPRVDQALIKSLSTTQEMEQALIESCGECRRSERSCLGTLRRAGGREGQHSVEKPWVRYRFEVE